MTSTPQHNLRQRLLDLSLHKKILLPFFLILLILGVVMIVEGVPWFLSPDGYKRILLQVLPVPDRLLRFLGLSLMLGGLFLVYLVKGLS